MLPHEFSATRHFSESSIHLSIRSSPLSSSLFTFALFKLTRWRSADATSHYSYLVFVKGSAAFPTPPKARKDAAGATTVVMPCSYATVDCLPTARPTDQPQPDRRARREEGRDGVVIGTTELWKAAGWRWVRATTTYGWLWPVRPLSFPLSLTHFN